MKYPLWNCGGPVTQRGPLWQLECELLPIVQGPSKKMGPNRLKNVLMVEKNATPILNNLPLRYKIKEIYNFNDDKILCNLLQEKKQAEVSFPTLFKCVSSSIMN